MKGEVIMFKKQVTSNVEFLDVQISKLLLELSELEDDSKYDRVRGKLDDLIEMRSDLAESRDRESLTPMILSGAIQFSSILTVLHYEKADIVTSKVFGIATRLFKEGV